MEQGPWSQPSAIYSSDHASFPKGLPDAYQRRLWSENNETKASEEKKNQKVSLSGQQVGWDASFSVEEDKRENGPLWSHWVKKWPHTIVTREARFPDSKLVTGCEPQPWAEVHTGLLCFRSGSQGSEWQVSHSPVRDVFFYNLVLRTMTSSEKWKLRANTFSKAPCASTKQRWAVSPDCLTPGLLPHKLLPKSPNGILTGGTSVLEQLANFHTDFTDGWKHPSSFSSIKPWEKWRV